MWWRKSELDMVNVRRGPNWASTGSAQDALVGYGTLTGMLLCVACPCVLVCPRAADARRWRFVA